MPLPRAEQRIPYEPWGKQGQIREKCGKRNNNQNRRQEKMEELGDFVEEKEQEVWTPERRVNDTKESESSIHFDPWNRADLYNMNELWELPINMSHWSQKSANNMKESSNLMNVTELNLRTNDYFDGEVWKNSTESAPLFIQDFNNIRHVRELPRNMSEWPKLRERKKHERGSQKRDAYLDESEKQTRLHRTQQKIADRKANNRDSEIVTEFKFWRYDDTNEKLKQKRQPKTINYFGKKPKTKQKRVPWTEERKRKNSKALKAYWKRAPEKRIKSQAKMCQQLWERIRNETDPERRQHYNQSMCRKNRKLVVSLMKYWKKQRDDDGGNHTKKLKEVMRQYWIRLKEEGDPERKRKCSEKIKAWWRRRRKQEQNKTQYYTSEGAKLRSSMVRRRTHNKTLDSSPRH
ncbi:hypothetical protein WDU94_000372 [Cyamophila willieti]